MKLAFDLKPGDIIVYKSLYEAKEAIVVDKPVDNNFERPKFAMGRIDLSNGEYIIGGTPIYDSVDECKEVIRKELEAKIKDTEDKIKYHKELLIIYKNRLERL